MESGGQIVMKIISAIFISLSAIANAQQVIPRDTSFTVLNTFVKEKKKFPFIEIAQPLMTAGIKTDPNVVYSKVGERKLLADVFHPQKKSKKLYPAVVMIFGGGWKSGDRSQNIPIAQRLAAKDYVAVTIDYRLSPEAPYPAALHDVKAAIRWLRANAEKYNVDVKKVAVLGMSAGGQLAALTGTTNGNKQFEGDGGNKEQSSSVQAIVDIDGVLAFRHPESSEGKVAAEWLGGTSAEKPQVWEEASPLTHAGINTPPILFINSSTPRFHAGRDDMIKKLDQSKVYSEMHTLPDTPHPFWFFHPWFEPTVNFTIDFLDKIFKSNNTTKSTKY